MRLVRLCLMLVAIYLYNPILANATLITFDELPDGTLINGATIDIVAFDFSIGGLPSSDAIIDGGPGDTPLITPLNIEGNADGVLGLNFATPVDSISYAFALNVFGFNVPCGSTITIFDIDGFPIDSTCVDAIVPPGFIFPEGTVNIVSIIPIVRAEVTFDNPFGRFAMDDLEFTPTTGPICRCSTVEAGGCISGTVSDAATGESLAGKTVTLRRVSPRKPRVVERVLTDADGCYLASNLEDGVYKIRVRRCKEGGVEVKVVANGGKINNVDFQCGRRSIVEANHELSLQRSW